MARVTDRYMCLGCGRFWRTDEPLVNNEHICPYCGDTFFHDNIQPNGPPNMYPEEIFQCPNGHIFHSDTPGDVKFCTFCRCDIASGTPEFTLFAWQERELERMGL